MASKESVAIFWDFENTPLASSLSGYEVVKEIGRIAHEYGTVTSFKAYFEIVGATSNKSKALRSELHSAGVSLTDCPHNGRKDVADKMIIVDMLVYAIDHLPPATIILISGDRDFAYAVSVLRLRRFRMVVIGPSFIHISLKLQASEYVDWDTEILAKMGTRKLSLSVENVVGIGNHEVRRHGDSPSSSSSLDILKSTTHDSCAVDVTDANNHLPPNHTSHDAAGSSTTLPQPLATTQKLFIPSDAQREDHVDNGARRSELTGFQSSSSRGPQPGESTDQGKILNQCPPSFTTTGLVLDSTGDMASFGGLPERSASQPQKDVQGHLPQSGASTPGTSVSNRSLDLVGRFPEHQAVVGTTSGTATLSSRLEISENSGSDRSDSSDAGSRHSEVPVVPNGPLRTRPEFWTKCRKTLVSLVTFKHLGSSPNSVFRDVGSRKFPSGSTLSSGSSFATASQMTTDCGPLAESSQPDDDRVHVDIITPILTPSDTITASAACTETRGVVLTHPSPTTPSISSDTGAAAVDCTITSPATVPRLLPITDLDSTTIATTSKSDDQSVPLHVTKSPRQAVLIPSRTVPPEFDALVKELQQHGARANRSAIASGLLKRDPLAYKRAHVKGKKQKFEKYVALAVKARIVTIGLAKGDEGGPTDWITLNPEWRLVAHDEPASVAVSTELAVTSGPDSISEASTSAAQLSRATDVPPLGLSPAGFSLLAERLRIMRSNDVPRPFRSLVAMDLIARDPTVYAQAGVQDFAEYATLAMHAGVVHLGGEGPRAWISLA